MRIFKRILISLFILAFAQNIANAQNIHRSHGHTLVGELKYESDFTHWNYVNPQAPKGGDIVQYAIGDFDSFNPFILEGRAAAGIGGIYDSLMVGNLDELGSHYGQIAEWMEWPDDYSWVIFKIRDEARWHDGVPITPADVIFSLETIKTQGHPFYGQYFANFSLAEDIGTNQVRIQFESETINRELPHIAGQLPILPKHYWETRDFTKATLEPPLGSGPFRIKNFNAPSSITYELVEDWWGKDLPVNLGLYNFGTITYEYYLDQTVVLEAFKAGEYDFRSENSSKQWALDYDGPALENGLIIKTLIPNYSPQRMQGFYLNLRKNKFKDRTVRQALQYVMDFEWMNEKLFYGQYTRTRSFFQNQNLAATGTPGPLELEYLEPHRNQLPEEVFTMEYNPPLGDGTGNSRAMLMKASELLKEAGWVIQDGKLVDEYGDQMTIEILLISPAFERIAAPVLQSMEQLGIAASQRTVETAQYQERTQKFDFDIIVASPGMSNSPGNELRDLWGCEAANTEGAGNISGLCHPVVEDLIGKIIAAPDREHLVALSTALDRVLQWNYIAIPHWYIASYRFAYWDMFGRPDITPKYGVGTGAWWVIPDKKAAIDAGRAGLGN